jgi:hypothetical protein
MYFILVASVVVGACVGDAATNIGTAHPFELSRAFWLTCGASIIGVTAGTVGARRWTHS